MGEVVIGIMAMAREDGLHVEVELRRWPKVKAWTRNLKELVPLFTMASRRRGICRYARRIEVWAVESRSFTSIFKMPICTLSCCSSIPNHFGHRLSCHKLDVSCTLLAT